MAHESHLRYSAPIPDGWSLSTLVEIEASCNTDNDGLLANVRANAEHDVPWLGLVQPHDGHAVMVGGGPSLARAIPGIRMRQANGQIVFALNNAANFLAEHGITPDYQLVLDARPENVRFVTRRSAKKYLIASQCHPSLFEALKGEDVTLFHWGGHLEEIGDLLVAKGKRTVLMTGAYVLGPVAMSAACALGYRNLHLYGYDSSDANDGSAHAYDQNETDPEKKRLEVMVGGEKFRCSFGMYKQAECFPQFASALMENGCSITVHGDGLLPAIAREMLLPVKDEALNLLTVYYDLYVCPASYDFVVPLVMAERERRKRRLDGLRVVIVPGPREGFRNDKFPPLDTEHRRQMLWGIVMGLCRCMPSVKSVMMLSSRAEAEKHVPPDGEVYPEEFDLGKPIPRYGMSFCFDEMKGSDLAFFSAPQWAKDQIAKWIKPGTVTLTLRESHYVEDRNSSSAWIEAADRLRSCGVPVVIVRDTECAFGPGPNGHDVFHPASYDMALRLALYEAAAVNCFTANGPWTLALLDESVKTLVFGVLRDGPHCLTEEHWKRRGMPIGSQIRGTYGRVKIVWDEESADTIVTHVFRVRQSNTNDVRPLDACYDLSRLPANFDAATWLVNAEMARNREGAPGPLRVGFKAGPNGGFRADRLPHTPQEREGYLENIVRPMLPMIGAVEDPSAAIEGQSFPYLGKSVADQARMGLEVPRLRASEDDLKAIDDWLAEHRIKDPIVITLREANHWDKRNSDIWAWLEFARRLDEQVLFVRDTEKADQPLRRPSFLTCPLASRHLNLRMALYTRAKCNLMTCQGPAMLVIYSELPYLLFKPLIDPNEADGWPAGTPDWWCKNIGVKPGNQFPWAREHQKIIWAPDSLDAIETAWRSFCEVRKAA